MAESVRKLTGNKAALRVVLDTVAGDLLNRIHRIDCEDGNRGTENIVALIRVVRVTLGRESRIFSLPSPDRYRNHCNQPLILLMRTTV